MHTPSFYRIYGLPLFIQRFLVMIAVFRAGATIFQVFRLNLCHHCKTYVIGGIEIFSYGYFEYRTVVAS